MTLTINSKQLAKCMFLGAAIALILISFFLYNAGDPNPEWGKYWMIRPLIIVPLAGAMGGLVFYIKDQMSYNESWKKILATIFCLIIYIIGIWIGSVLGLDGTMWN